MGSYDQLGYIGTIGMQYFQIGMHLGPKTPILGLKMGPKYHFSVTTGQKRCQSDKNHIWVGSYDQLGYISTIGMQYYQIGMHLRS